MIKLHYFGVIKDFLCQLKVTVKEDLHTLRVLGEENEEYK